jgi:hypothetical protein
MRRCGRGCSYPRAHGSHVHHLPPCHVCRRLMFQRADRFHLFVPRNYPPSSGTSRHHPATPATFRPPTSACCTRSTRRKGRHPAPMLGSREAVPRPVRRLCSRPCRMTASPNRAVTWRSCGRSYRPMAARRRWHWRRQRGRSQPHPQRLGALPVVAQLPPHGVERGVVKRAQRQ